MLWTRKIPRIEFLEKEKSQGNDSKLTFNVTYYPVFRHLKSQLKELHVILAYMKIIKKYFLKYQLSDANHVVEKDLLANYAVT